MCVTTARLSLLLYIHLANKRCLIIKVEPYKIQSESDHTFLTLHIFHHFMCDKRLMSVDLVNAASVPSSPETETVGQC